MALWVWNAESEPIKKLLLIGGHLDPSSRCAITRLVWNGWVTADGAVVRNGRVLPPPVKISPRGYTLIYEDHVVFLNLRFQIAELSLKVSHFELFDEQTLDGPATLIRLSDDGQTHRLILLFDGRVLQTLIPNQRIDMTVSFNPHWRGLRAYHFFSDNKYDGRIKSEMTDLKVYPVDGYRGMYFIRGKDVFGDELCFRTRHSVMKPTVELPMTFDASEWPPLPSQKGKSVISLIPLVKEETNIIHMPISETDHSSDEEWSTYPVSSTIPEPRRVGEVVITGKISNIPPFRALRIVRDNLYIVTNDGYLYVSYYFPSTLVLCRTLEKEFVIDIDHQYDTGLIILTTPRVMSGNPPSTLTLSIHQDEPRT